MVIATICIAGFLVSLGLLHALAAKFFNVIIVNGKRPVNESFNPNTKVLLSIRGCDPSLENNLRNLLQQEYENYQVIAVVDHQSDAAWSVVHHIKSEFDTENRLMILELENPLNSCSLKCSALVQAIDKINDETEVIVIMDADVTPHEEWLRQAVSPLHDSSVGVVTGNQWFEPRDESTGSFLRSIWNAGALVPTAVLANPWAGTCAMRLNEVRSAGLIETWKKSIVDDGPIRYAMKPLGKKIVFNPELIMVNRENCTVPYVHRYVPRMLTWSRIYEKTFILTFAYMLLQVGSTLSTITLGLVGLAQLNWQILAVSVLALFANIALNIFGYVTVRNSIARIERRREHHLDPLQSKRIWNIALLVPVCQICFGFWIIKSMVTRRVNWREITYEVNAHDDVRMLNYRPLQVSDAEPSKVSI